MATLSYTALMSIDGYLEDADGRFEFAMPDHEVHEAANELQRQVGTNLYGRRMYETMAVWQDVGDDADPAEQGFAEAWRAADKVVWSRTLADVWTPRTRLEREFDADAVQRLKEQATAEISVSGPGLAQHAFAAGLVDEVHLFAFPVVIGAGKPALPTDLRVDLELLDEHRFASGVVHLHHRVRPARG